MKGNNMASSAGAADTMESKIQELERKMLLESELRKSSRTHFNLPLNLPTHTRPVPGQLNLGLAPAPPGRRVATDSPLGNRKKPFMQNMQLAWSPQPPPGSSRVPDEGEIEARYQEIMKLAGIINIDGQKIHCKPEDFEEESELGHGTCGHVMRMRHRQTGKSVAVKVMRRTGNKEESKRIIMDLEVVLKSHSCPYIVLCLGIFVSTEEVWVCMELMATCLDKLLRRLKAPIPEYILGKTAVAIVHALNYLKEEHGVIHRDVKPSNILLDSSGAVKLCDFGISGRLVDSKAITRTGTGCAAYMAPERIDPPDPAKPDYDIRADVWSLGISMVELATGEFPYKDCKTEFALLAMVLKEDAPCLPPDAGFSLEFSSFVAQCLTKDYRSRPKYRQLLLHPFIRRWEVEPVDTAAWFAAAIAPPLFQPESAQSPDAAVH